MTFDVKSNVRRTSVESKSNHSCNHRVTVRNSLFDVTDKLEKKVRELYDIVCRLEEEKYDWEFKLRKMDFEVRNRTIIIHMEMSESVQ